MNSGINQQKYAEALAQLLQIVKEQADVTDQLSRLAEAKIEWMREAHRQGLSKSQIAAHCVITRQRVQQLLKRGS
jgi:site-specific recombinase XerC